MANKKMIKKKTPRPETRFEKTERNATEFKNANPELLWFNDDILECIAGISQVLMFTAEEFSERDRDYIEMFVEMHKDDEHMSKKALSKEALYSLVIDSVSQDIYEFLAETNDFLRQIYAKRKLFSSTPEGAKALPIIIEILSILQHFIDKGNEAIELFEFAIGYGFYDSPEHYKKIHGIDITKHYKKREEIGLEEYEDACENILLFTTYIEEYKAGFRLYELANKLQAFYILMGGSIKENRDEATMREFATLKQFMRDFCEKQSQKLLRYRRKSVNDAHSRKTVTLPEHVGEWRTGQSKKYKVSDLKKNWPGYCGILPNLPALK